MQHSSALPIAPTRVRSICQFLIICSMLHASAVSVLTLFYSSIISFTVSDSPLSVNFLIYQPGSVMRIPFAYENADLSTDLRRGSFVARINRYIECTCTGKVPAYIMVDLTGKEKNDVIRVNHLVFPPGVRPSRTVKDDFVVAVIQSAKTTK